MRNNCNKCVIEKKIKKFIFDNDVDVKIETFRVEKYTQLCDQLKSQPYSSSAIFILNQCTNMRGTQNKNTYRYLHLLEM